MQISFLLSAKNHSAYTFEYAFVILRAFYELFPSSKSPNTVSSYAPLKSTPSTGLSISMGIFLVQDELKAYRTQKEICKRKSLFSLSLILGEKLELQTKTIGNHCDKFGVCRLSARIVNGVSEIRVQNVNVASIPSNLNGVANSSFNTRGGS